MSDDDEEDLIEIEVPAPRERDVLDAFRKLMAERDRIDQETAKLPMILGRFPVRRSRIWPLLSVDGGGMRGLVAARLLQEVEKRLPNPLGHYFSVGAGTSTGALVVAAALGTDQPKNGEEIAKLYRQLGEDVFADGWIRRHRRLMRTGSRYRDDTLREAIKGVVGDRRFGDAPKRLIVPVTAEQARAGRVLDNRHDDDDERDAVAGLPLAEVLMASAAAPSYLPPVKLAGDYYLDGGLWANNPTQTAIDQIRDSATDHGPVGFVVSIGTGLPKPPSGSRSLRTRSGRARYGALVGDVIGQIPTERMLVTMPLRRVEVVRLQVDLPVGVGRLDEAESSELDRLEQAVDDALPKLGQKLDRAREVLTALRP